MNNKTVFSACACVCVYMLKALSNDNVMLTLFADHQLLSPQRTFVFLFPAISPDKIIRVNGEDNNDD